MSTHKHFETGIELHSLSIIGYNRNINGMRSNFKESHFSPLNPLDADRLAHTSHTPTSRINSARRWRRQCAKTQKAGPFGAAALHGFEVTTAGASGRRGGKSDGGSGGGDASTDAHGRARARRVLVALQPRRALATSWVVHRSRPRRSRARGARSRSTGDAQVQHNAPARATRRGVN